MKVYQAGEAQTSDEIIVEFDFMWSGQQVILVICFRSPSCSHTFTFIEYIHRGVLLDMAAL